MKTMKKLLALTLALVMVLAMALTVSAATTTITIKGGNDAAVYEAYRLMDVTDGGKNDDGVEMYAYTFNEDTAAYETALKKVTGATDLNGVLNYLKNIADKSDEAREFADDIYAEIKNLDADAESANGVFSNVPQGYYLIVEKTPGEQDTYSLVMLDTAGKDGVEVETKEDTPELIKKVQEKNDSTGYESGWQDGADYDIGDPIKFQLTGDVSDKIASYEHYYYEFSDSMCDGLTFKKIDKVTVDGTELHQADGDYTLTVDADKHGFSLVIMDLTKFDATADTKVVVEYTATLEGTVVIGAPGNENKAHLEYSNNPYNTGNGTTKPEDTTVTPDDKVVVFTFDLVVDKYDGKNSIDTEDDELLDGASFTLYKWNNELTTTDKWEVVEENIKADGKTQFTFTGLDSGRYKLVESDVPDGYNQAPDVEFYVEATYTYDDVADPELTGLVIKGADGTTVISGDGKAFSTNLESGVIATDVINNSGVELPSTGGIGTTIFYVVGGLLTLGAVILLVTKKKMSAAE